MGSFLDQARKTQDEKRGLDKDPADLSDSKEPDWDNPETWAGGAGNGDSASGNADENSDQEQHSADTKTQKPAPPNTSLSSTRRQPRRRGRPRGPERVPLTVRILPPTDRKLTAAVEQTGLNPQTLVEDALKAYFRWLKIQDPGPQTNSDSVA